MSAQVYGYEVLLSSKTFCDNHPVNAFLYREANTIFRGNSLATRCMDETMKIVGNHYLKVTLKNVIDEVIKLTHLAFIHIFAFFALILKSTF